MEIEKMNEEELIALSMEKNSKGVATKRALRAQKQLCGDRIVVITHDYDDYTGEIDYYDEFFLEKTSYWQLP